MSIQRSVSLDEYLLLLKIGYECRPVSEGGDVGRQVLYVDGHDMLVRLGGKKGKLLPVIPLDPTGSRAMAESRHPATEMGLLHLIDVLLKYRKRDFTLKQGVRWEMLPDQKFTDRVCDCWIVEYDNREVEPIYRAFAPMARVSCICWNASPSCIFRN